MAHCFCPETRIPQRYPLLGSTIALKAGPAQTLPDANAKSDVNGVANTTPSAVHDVNDNQIDTEDNDDSFESTSQNTTLMLAQQLNNDDD